MKSVCEVEKGNISKFFFFALHLPPQGEKGNLPVEVKRVVDLIGAEIRQTLAVQAFLAATTETDIVRLVTDFSDVPFGILAKEVVLQVSPRDSARLLALALKALACRRP